MNEPMTYRIVGVREDASRSIIVQGLDQEAAGAFQRGLRGFDGDFLWFEIEPDMAPASPE